MVKTIEQTYSVREVAELLDVNRRTVLLWLKRGKLSGKRLPPGRYGKREWRIPESELNRLLESDD